MKAVVYPYIWHYIGINGLPTDDLIIKVNDEVIVWNAEGEVSKLEPLSQPVYIAVERFFIHAR